MVDKTQDTQNAPASEPLVRIEHEQVGPWPKGTVLFLRDLEEALGVGAQRSIARLRRIGALVDHHGEAPAENPSPLVVPSLVSTGNQEPTSGVYHFAAESAAAASERADAAPTGPVAPAPVAPATPTADASKGVASEAPKA